MKKVFILLTMLLFFSFSNASSVVSEAGFYQCRVHVDYLNVRSGPSSSYKIVATVKKGTVLKALGRIYGWYLVQTDNDTFGMVNGWYITPITNTTNNNTNNNATPNTTMGSDEQVILNLVNEARKNAGLSELKTDSEIMRVAEIKAQDMEDNNYFSHTSPTYGSPFDMLKSFGVSYKSAGENIAGHSTAKNAFEAWMNSSGHKANILNSNYNYTGIGVVESDRYGKMLVQMFVER